MSTETQPTGATTTTADRSVELVNRLLKLPEEVRLDLANLLLDSVREGFTSLEEAARKQKERIHARVAELVGGKAELVDPEQVFAAMRKRVDEVRKQ